MTTIDGHTIDERFLKDGWIIDGGCRWFNLSKAFPDKKVYAIDIEDFNISEIPHNTTFRNAALTNKNGETNAYFFGNGSGNFIEGINGVPGNTEDRPCETKKVECITMNDVYADIGKDIDLFKADLEGCEYFILQDFEPIPKMISVESHQHVHENLHNQYWPTIFEQLCKHYNASLHIREWPRYKYMDCLFIRKDLI